MYVIIKNMKVEPADLDNRGGRARLSAEAITTVHDAAIKNVELVGSQVPNAAPRSLRPVRGQIINATREGFYETSLAIPPLIDPGEYELTLRARDSEGYTGRAKTHLRITYRRPPYEGSIDSPENRATLAKLAHAPIVPGNAVEVLWDGETALARRLELIESAKRQINLQNYVFAITGIGRQVYEALLPRLDKGVEANVLLNAGTQIPGAMLSTLRLSAHRILAEIAGFLEDQGLTLGAKLSGEEVQKHLRAWKRQNVNLELFGGSLFSKRGLAPQSESAPAAVWLVKMIKDSLGEDFFGENSSEGDWRQQAYRGPGGLPAIPLLDYAIHEKILLADARRAIVGGRNLSDEYFAPWIDVDVLLEGPVVKQVQRGFVRSFLELAETAEPPTVADLRPRLKTAGPSDVQFVQSRPWRGEYYTLNALVTAIQMARKRVYAYSQYLVLPDGLLLDALLDAAQRGVDVQIITNSQTAGQELYWSTGYFVSLNYFARLLKAGIKIYLNPGTPEQEEKQPYLHAKEFLIDDELTMIGSFNLSTRSCFVESENLVNIFDRRIAEDELARFAAHRRDAVEVTPTFMRDAYREHRTTMEFARSFELFF
ncbi:MAG: phosphatidylserine/phosphatidylglycerophosphate/cardiolipin synthase family protein [Candidatus Lernaella stagnicola]|nr:phosphatidylserine/phosphatidylglycerophosphate/cardiolipin synthase family protein [Candidatus Lernaella stagnicola]